MKTIIIGIGNEFRSDDAIGIIAARKLKEKNLINAEVIEHNGDGASLMEIWKNCEQVILIDAANINNCPGQIHIIDAKADKIPKSSTIHSSHIFSVAEAIETSRTMGTLPERMVIYGIEGKNFKAGTKVSEEISIAVDKVVKKIVNVIDI